MANPRSSRSPRIWLIAADIDGRAPWRVEGGGIALSCLLNHWAGFALGAGVVDCGVEVPEALDRPVDETADIILVPHVGLNEFGLGAERSEFADQCLTSILIMPMAGGGFEQCYNAQAAVAAGSLLVVAVDVVQAPSAKQQLAPMLGKIGTCPMVGRPRNASGGRGLFQRGECRDVREGRDRTADRHGPSAASSAAG